MNPIVSSIFGLLLLAISLSGCDKPDTEIYTSYGLFNEHQKLSAKHTALQNEFNVLKANYEGLREVKAERDTYLDNYNALAREYARLQIELTILEVQYQAIQERYNALTTGFSTTQTDSVKALEQINGQYQELLERHKVIDAQIEALRNKKVKILSDNLTDSEYEAFYKGLNLWWNDFN